jgi:nucleoside-diphosphate-sugar epimerase
LDAYSLPSYLLDIDHLTPKIFPFFHSDILIINITSKNITSFKNLISIINQSPIKKVLFVSSTSVYANTNNVVTESDGLEQINHPLFCIENLFRYQTHFETTIVRFAGLIGANRHPGRFFKKGKIVPQADAPVNLIHQDDCLGIISEIIKQSIWNQTFNACADAHPSKREFYSYARKQLNLAAPVFSDEAILSYKIVSNEKSKQRLNYHYFHNDLMSIEFDDITS